MGQKVIHKTCGYDVIGDWFYTRKCRKLLLVSDGAVRFQTGLMSYLESLRQDLIIFSDFESNPKYESVVKGVEVFRSERCDAILAVGGGSAIDVAKCIKRFSGMQGDGSEGSFLNQISAANQIPFMAIPTTAGTGAESTKYAVIYYLGEKQSITDENCIPDTVLLDSDTLRTLPLYQRKATMMDALCHAVESFWSINSTEQSRSYSREAIQKILKYKNGYLCNSEEGNAGMLEAANIAGRAINISQTTAGHAMCYKLTSLYGCAHGHAAALCDRVLFEWMIDHTNLCIDVRGEKYLKEILDELGRCLGGIDGIDGAHKFVEMVKMLDFSVPEATEEEYECLKKSVNPVRLKNHPVALDEAAIDGLYHKILRCME